MASRRREVPRREDRPGNVNYLRTRRCAPGQGNTRCGHRVAAWVTAPSTVDGPWRKMPRKVQPYGSSDDIEAAALARSRPNPEPGYVNELAATMTIGEVATQAVEACRALNQLMADAGELSGPGEAREVVGGLGLMGHKLPELCEQLARFLVAQREDGQISQGTGGDPDGVLVEVSEALSAAGRAADMMAAGLAEGGT